MPLLLGAIRVIPAIISAFALFFIGAGAVWWWDRRPEGFPTVRVWLFKWKAPDSLGAQIAQFKAREARLAAQAKSIGAKQQSASAAISERQTVTQERIRWRTEHTIERIPVYVTREVDRSYPLSNGFVLLHDAAATGADPDALPRAPGEPNDAASAVKASQAIGTIVTNYGACHSDAERLRGLQEWVRAMRAASSP